MQMWQPLIDVGTRVRWDEVHVACRASLDPYPFWLQHSSVVLLGSGDLLERRLGRYETFDWKRFTALSIDNQLKSDLSAHVAKMKVQATALKKLLLLTSA